MTNLMNVLENLKSDKVKERQEGLSAIRTLFSEAHTVDTFSINKKGENDPRAWLSVFQALFTTVLTEKLACTKRSSTKNSATAEKRLAEAASIVRWLTEKTVTMMNKRVAKALFDHLTQIMVHKNELFMPVALDYVKALKCLVSYTPHVEHLGDELWVKLVEMGFNAVLGDPVTKSFWDGEVSADVVMHDELYEDDDDEEDGIPTKKRRRARGESEHPQPSTSKIPAKQNHRVLSVSLEQIEFISLLAILLRSPSAPFLSYYYDEKDNDNHLTVSILNRLKRFLHLYPTDSSLLHDFLSILSATLSHLALNKRQEVEDFARATWDDIVGFWSVKDKRLKEGVVTVLRILFHYITSEDSHSQIHKSSSDCIDGIRRLWNLLDAEADSRRGIDGLSFDSLRLQLRDEWKSDDEELFSAFTTQTFRAGWHFDASQALSWAVLELQADCASKLYLYSESMQTSGSSGTYRGQNKRPKLENPIKSLLSSITLAGSAPVRIYHLQTLLFIIERHWSILHKRLRQEVLETLFQFISYEDGGTQSWVLLCMGSVAYAEVDQAAFESGNQEAAIESTVWDSVWSHAIRRVNVPLVSRAACHTAHVLLSLTTQLSGSLRLPLSSQRILSEVETLTKDIDVQGPLYPYDSVCTFLAHCLKVTSQDVKLYRMHLEEKVLSWLVDNWKLTTISKGQMPLHQVVDVLLLLESVCGFNRKTDFAPQLFLPDCLTAHALTEEERTKPIQDFLLHAKVPRFKKPISNSEYVFIGPADGDLVQPKGRERKVSAFFQRSLEILTMEWDLVKEDYARLTAEMARRSLDLAVAALSFEALLIVNGINSDRRVTQSGAKLVTTVIRALKEAPWTNAEKALVSLGLEPFVFVESNENNQVPWQVMVPPNNGTGIRKSILHRLTSHDIKRRERRKAARMDFLRVLWQITDVQDQFLGEAIPTLRDVLHNLAGNTSGGAQSHTSRAVDGKDDFEPIRAGSVQKSGEALKHRDEEPYLRHIFSICIGFLTVGPSLQSAAGEPTRDKELMTFILTCAEKTPDKFLIVCPMLLGKIRQRVLFLAAKALDKLLKELSGLLEMYAYSRSPALQGLVIQMLQSTMDLWLTQQVSDSEVGDMIRQLCFWLSGALRKKKINSWLIRDTFSVFLDGYLERDPEQLFWSTTSDDELSLPTALLMSLNSDYDIRVRFRVATIVSRLFSVARRVKMDPMAVYGTLRQHFTNNLDHSESMLTRTLALGNIMVISSEVRRGAYWHILETCFFTNRYNSHIEAVLTSVSQRMGLTNFSQLFDAYASQMAYSICKMNAAIHQLSPSLLGYRDRLECAEATFRSFSPSAIVESPQLFDNHCAVLQKTTAQGINECFGDIVGLLIVIWLADPPHSTEGLESYLKEHTALNDDDFAVAFGLNIDRIAASVLKSLGDQEVSLQGPIAVELHRFDTTGASASAFERMTRFRAEGDFHPHLPNLPAHPTKVILEALKWIASQYPEAGERATTYHIMHQLFADIQASPLVNEQYRLVNSLTLWIAVHHHTFKDLALLHSLLHGAASMLSQADLARPAESILDWAFCRYTKERIKDSRLSNVLIRIACYANEHARNAQDTSIANLGSDILQWIDEQVLLLEDSEPQNPRSIFRPHILRALPAWSHQQSIRIAELYRRVNSETLSSILIDHRITTNKFRIVRRLRDQTVIEGCSTDRFEKNDFWRLKECTPPASDLQIEDADAFAELLYLHKGRVDSFGTEQLASESIRQKHRLTARQTSVTDGDITAARDSITLALLGMLDCDKPSQVHLAYQTLRRIMSVIPAEAFSLNTWSSEIKDELQLLQRYRWTPRSRALRHLDELHDRDTFIIPASRFPQWISTLTILLADTLATSDIFFAQLTPVLQIDIEFAEQILPVLIHRLLRSDINAGEHSCKVLLSNYFTQILSLETVDVPCIRVVVDTVLHLRHFTSPKSSDALAYNKWLDIDYLLLAKSALKCGAYTTALLFLELAREFRNGTDEEPSIEEVLYEIYGHIDEPDGFYGIKSRDLHRFLIKRFHHEKQWDKALRFHGAALESGSRESGEAEGLLEAFHAFGFDQLAIDTLRSSSALASNVLRTSCMNYRLGWRTETWDLPDTTETTTGASLYRAVRSIYRERDNQAIERVIRSSLFAEVGRLRHLGAENLAEIRETTRDIMCLGEISRWRSQDVQARLAVQQTDINLWNDFVTIDDGFGFHDLESILATRISLIRSARQKEERLQIGNMTTAFTRGLIELEKSCLIRLSAAARSDGQVQIALNAVVRAQRLEDKPSFNVSQEFANVLWLQKEDKLAPEFLKSLLMNDAHADAVPIGRRASLFAQLGTWTAEACVEKPTDIRDQFFAPAVKMLDRKGIDDCRSCATVYYQYAVFSDRQYHAILKSPDAIRWKVYVQRKTQEIERRQQELRRTQNVTRVGTLQREQMQAQKLLHEDSERFTKHNLARDTFLKQAIEMYSRCLEASDDFDNDAVIRLASLWFANFDDDQGIYQEVGAALDRIPSRKMIFLSHQLSARLSKPPAAHIPHNQINLQRLVLRMSREHPFHTLYQVYCLHPDRSAAGKRQSGRHSAPQTQTDRMAAADDIFEQLKQDETSASRVRDVEALCDACLKWAEYPIKNDKQYKHFKTALAFKVPDDMPLKSITNIKIPVLTCRTPVDASMKYDNCVWIARYDTTFETAGGVNLPKISICYGSDGQRYKQLFKGEGNDDLRQDAVMEQVFDLVNHVLHNDRETRRRHLKIRGYKVIPLSSQAGVIEFVTNTSPLKDWLMSAHDRYHPEDIKFKDVIGVFRTMQEEWNRSPDVLPARYAVLMKKFQPVMRHFFTERQRVPISWFTMRLNYTRSVASSSIIGHVLGLGDRHISNILMDNRTGEVVHIDLGIAFDQGKLLHVPERVPFRLTRDMVDGMGSSGTQGVFQRCAEETLRVLRENSEVIMTILEVFKHDPLHTWTASEIKLKQVQPGTSLQHTMFGIPPDPSRLIGIGIDLSSGSAEEAADRALSSVSRKLDSSLSVQCMINELIAEATDITNLAAMYTGWSPFC